VRGRAAELLTEKLEGLERQRENLMAEREGDQTIRPASRLRRRCRWALIR
jgi:hypothetical protein